MGTMSATAVAAAEEDNRGRGVWMQYVDALEEERRKIQVFRRELPLCLELVTQTIESYREQMRISSCGNGSDMVVDHRPAAVLEEFIPRKRSDATRSSSTHEEEGVNSRMVDGIDGEEPAAAGACCSERKVSKEEEEEGEGEIGSENPLMPTADWLNLAQLWHHNTESSVKEVCMQEQPSHQEEQNHQLQPPPTKPILVEARRPTGAFQPFCRPKPASTPAAPADTSSSAAPAAVATPIVVAPPPPPPASQQQPQQPTAVEESSTNDSAGDGRGGSGAGMTAESSGHASSTGDQELLQQQKKVEAGGGHTQSSSGTSSNHRKSRRCWSPELHRRFLNAIKQLGGSHVATPKQIRDLMKVDGLTNDEVKSHLQKYRLHTRRPAMTPVTGAPTHTTPHFLLVSGIWLPPQEYTAAAAAASQQPQGHHSGVLAPSATPSPKPPSSPPQVCCKQVVASAPVIETRPSPQSQSKASENKGLPQPGSSTTSSTSSHTSQ